MGREVLPGGPPAELTEQRSDVVLFACGDPAHAEHDSVAIAAAKSLPQETAARIDLKLSGPMRPEYLRDLAPGTHVLVADTVPGTPGEIIEVTFLELSGREESFPTTATADPPLDEVVAMAQLLRDQPLRGSFLGLGVDVVDLAAPPPDELVDTFRRTLVRAIVELDRDAS